MKRVARKYPRMSHDFPMGRAGNAADFVGLTEHGYAADLGVVHELACLQVLAVTTKERRQFDRLPSSAAAE